MPGNSRELITTAERRFPVRIRIAVPPSGLGQRYPQITARLDQNCGADGWAMTPSGTREPLNDAIFDLLRRCHARERVCRPVVRRG
jgi:hypothetical protein